MTLSTDFVSQEYLRNPSPTIARLRSAGPVVEVKLPIIGKVWMTTTQELAGRVLKDSDTFTLRDEDARRPLCAQFAAFSHMRIARFADGG